MSKGKTDYAINYLLDQVAALNNQLQVQTVTPTLTASASSYHTNSATMHVYGKVVQLKFNAYCSSGAVAAGDNIYRGTLANTAYRPIATCICTTYYNAKAIGALIDTSGAITVRNSSTGSLPQNGQVAISFTYLIA